MSDATKIEWTDATWNPVTGCSVVSPGCTNCYAMKLAGTRLQHHPSRAGLTRETKAGPVWNGTVRFNEEWLTQPLLWKRPRMIFVCAHGDLFHEDVPDEWIDKVFAVMALASHHTFQVLTKRAARMRAYLVDLETSISRRRAFSVAYRSVGASDELWLPHFPFRNVWLGVSAEDQKRADDRVIELLRTPAAIRFVSAEPLLGSIDFTNIGSSTDISSRLGIDALTGNVVRVRYIHTLATWPKLDWIIIGGESGSGARPMHPDWPRQIRDQCEATGTAFFFKQWGTWGPRRTAKQDDLFDARQSRIVSPNGSVTSGLMSYPDNAWVMDRATKTITGRLLDGVEHNAMPRAA